MAAIRLSPRFLTAIACLSMFGVAGASPATDKVLENVRLPAGFRMEVYADDVPGARSMALGQNGTLFLGTRAVGKVYAVSPPAKPGAKPTTRVIAEKLLSPNGVAFRDGALYV